ncbi:hypothetical protein MTR_1g068880 [Medicago truncatula]|uniref:Uncharacterized protein n=1 Tax=Medicago truncatula TaxID=3880 RepID=A0A072VWF1_MEDTR|nr:hypothetical protein MTR_1g068880 [Medicago truncatula]
MIETTANPIPQFDDSYKVNDETKANRFSGLKRMKMGHTNSQVPQDPSNYRPSDTPNENKRKRKKSCRLGI